MKDLVRVGYLGEARQEAEVDVIPCLPVATSPWFLYADR